MIADRHGRQPSKSKNSNATSIQMMSVDSICPNSYNPNHMTDDEFNEFVSEVRHLGRLPKPVIVRQLGELPVESSSEVVTVTTQNGQTHEIVDGEHGWRAAKEVGLTEIPVEVDDLDDYEARRQTYKRNQHGTHKPVLLGRMFQEMLDDHGISQRELAKDIQVSEGTIRNMLLYSQADDLRNRYAPSAATIGAKGSQMQKYRREIGDLSVGDVRCYIKLPAPIGDIWLDSGADKSVLWKPWNPSFDLLDDGHTCADAEFSNLVERYEELVSSGALDYLKGTPLSPSSFERHIRGLVQWEDFNRKYECKGVSLSEIREYTKHYLWGVFYVRDEHLMRWALNRVLQPARLNEAGELDPGQFLLTPEEFEQTIEQTGKERSSPLDFERRLDLAVQQKHGSRPDTNLDVQMHLLEMRIQEEAPGFIRDADLHPQLKEALWEAAGSEEAKRQFIANDDRVYASKRQSLRDAVASRLEWIQRCSDAESAYHNKTAEQHAQTIAERLYDPKEKPEVCQELAGKLVSVFARAELVTIEASMAHCEEMRKMFHDLMARIGGGDLAGDEPE